MNSAIQEYEKMGIGMEGNRILFDMLEQTELYGILDELEDGYTDEEKEKILNNWENKYGNIINCTFFGDTDLNVGNTEKDD